MQVGAATVRRQACSFSRLAHFTFESAQRDACRQLTVRLERAFDNRGRQTSPPPGHSAKVVVMAESCMHTVCKPRGSMHLRTECVWVEAVAIARRADGSDGPADVCCSWRVCCNRLAARPERVQLRPSLALTALLLAGCLHNCVAAKQEVVHVVTAQDLQEALLDHAVEHVVVTQHLDLSALSDTLPLKVHGVQKTIRVCCLRDLARFATVLHAVEPHRCSVRLATC